MECGTEPAVGSRTAYWWTTFRGNNERTGNISGIAPVQKHIVWTTDIPSAPEIVSSPCILDGFVYVGAMDGNVYSLRENNGGIYWTSVSYGGVSSPCIYGSRVYSSDVQINKDSGSKLLGSLLGRSSPLVNGLDLYLAIAKYNAISNTNAWTNMTDGYSSPSLYNGKVYVGTYSTTVGYPNYVSCLANSTGNPIWQYNTGGQARSVPAVANDRVFYHANNQLICLDADTSDGVDEGLADGSVQYDRIWTQAVQGRDSSPSVANGKVYITGSDGNVYCFWASNGTQAWSKAGFGNALSSIAYCSGMIYFGGQYSGGLDTLVCMWASNGSVAWYHDSGATAFPTMGGPYSSPAIANNSVYWCSANGKVIRFFVSSDITPPTVSQVSPTNKQNNVMWDTKVVITFSESLDPATVLAQNIVVENATGVPLTGSVTYDDANHKVTFTPSRNFTRGQTYKVTLKTGFTDAVGNAFDGNKNGVAQDGAIDEYNWTFNVKPNTFPMLLEQQVSPASGVPNTHFYYRVKYQDADNDPPAFVRISINNGSIQAPLVRNASAPGTLSDMNFSNGEEYVFDTVHTVVGIQNYLLNTSDGVTEVSTSLFKAPIVVNYPNTRPMIAPIPAQNCVEDVPKTVDLATYLTDDYTPVDALTLTSNMSMVYAKKTNLTFTVLNGVTHFFVNITVSDGELSSYTNIEVFSTPVNDPPQWGYVNPEVKATEDVPYILDLNTSIFDPDHTKDELVLTTNSSYATVSGAVITLTYPNGVLQDWINITLTDGLLYNYTHVHATVTAVNDPPEQISDFTITIIDSDLNTTLLENLTISVSSPAVADVDGGPIQYKWDFGDKTSTVSGKDATHTYAAPGNYTITLLYTDQKIADYLRVEKNVTVLTISTPVDDDDDDDIINVTDDDDNKDDEGISTLTIVIIIIIAVVLLAMIVAVIILVIRRKHEPEPAPAAQTGQDEFFDDGPIGSAPPPGCLSPAAYHQQQGVANYNQPAPQINQALPPQDRTAAAGAQAPAAMAAPPAGQPDLAQNPFAVAPAPGQPQAGQGPQGPQYGEAMPLGTLPPEPGKQPPQGPQVY